jgi:RNA polymerase sigma factor (sigma-70 family)
MNEMKIAEMETLPRMPQMRAAETIAKIAEFQKTTTKETQPDGRIKVVNGSGNVALRNSIIDGNIGLAYQVANKFKNRMDFEDAVQVAAQAMIRAIETFDADRDLQFSTHAENCMEVKITRDIENNGQTVQQPCHAQNLIREYKRVANMLRANLNRDPFPDEVGELLVHHREIAQINKQLSGRMSPNQEEALVQRRGALLRILGRNKPLKSQPAWTLEIAQQVAQVIATHTTSIIVGRTTCSNRGDGDKRNDQFSLIQALRDDRVATPEEVMDMEEACSALRSAIDELGPREKEVLRLRFEEKTLEQVAETMINPTTGRPLTRERIRQIEEQTLLVLRAYLKEFGADPRKVVKRKTTPVCPPSKTSTWKASMSS